MAGSSASEVIFISVNNSITLMGKLWLIVLVFLRVLILLFAGYPLYQDEQERFVCNTIQPGCANVCYDLFSPVSLFRFWLVQLVASCLPFVVFIVYVVHKVTNDLTAELSSPGPVGNTRQQRLCGKTLVKKTSLGAEGGRARRFTGAYILHLMFRTLLEAGFGAAHYYLFGFYISRRFLCQHPPCTTQVDCYISRPTEKTVMLNFMLGVAALSLLLNALDFICAIKRSVRRKSKAKMMVESIYEEEQGFLSAAGASSGMDPNNSLSQQVLETDSGQSGSFRKRRGSKGSCAGPEASSAERSSLPGSPGPPAFNTNGNNGYSAAQEEALERDGSELALCPPEPLGTPRSIRVSKRSRLKPPPPPRRDLLLHGNNSTAMAAACPRRVGQCTLVELAGGAELQTTDDGQEKRAEWV